MEELGFCSCFDCFSKMLKDLADELSQYIFLRGNVLSFMRF